jgi:hypothetical protein
MPDQSQTEQPYRKIKLSEDSWRSAIEKYRAGSIVYGRVVMIEEPNTLVVEIEPGVIGKLFYSRHSATPELPEVGKRVKATLFSIDKVTREIALDFIALAEERVTVVEPAPAAPEQATTTTPVHVDDRPFVLVICGAGPLAALEDMDPNFLAKTLGPYLEALARLQGIIDQALNRPVAKIKIGAIEQKMRITITQQGLKEAVQFTCTKIDPKIKEYAYNLDLYKDQERQAHNDRARAEVIEARSRAAQDSAAATRSNALDKEKKNRVLELKLRKTRLDLITELLASTKDNLADDEKLFFAAQLDMPIETLLSSGLRLSVKAVA